MNEIDFIPYGKENRISKTSLAQKLNITIDEVDTIISKLRKKYIILSDTKIGGYWRPNTRVELLKFIRTHNSRHLTECELIQMAWDEFDRIGRNEQ